MKFANEVTCRIAGWLLTTPTSQLLCMIKCGKTRSNSRTFSITFFKGYNIMFKTSFCFTKNLWSLGNKKSTRTAKGLIARQYARLYCPASGTKKDMPKSRVKFTQSHLKLRMLRSRPLLQCNNSQHSQWTYREAKNLFRKRNLWFKWSANVQHFRSITTKTTL